MSGASKETPGMLRRGQPCRLFSENGGKRFSQLKLYWYPEAGLDGGQSAEKLPSWNRTRFVDGEGFDRIRRMDGQNCQ